MSKKSPGAPAPVTKPVPPIRPKQNALEAEIINQLNSLSGEQKLRVLGYLQGLKFGTIYENNALAPVISFMDFRTAKLRTEAKGQP